jgi:hypothetical protein
VSELDPDRLSGADATSIYGSLAGAERLVLAGKALLAPRIEASGVWRDSGHRDAASLLASVEGVSAGQARRTLAVGQRLGELPGTEQAVRRGELSGPKVTELTGAGIVDPTREADLLAGADSEPLARVKERCLRARAASAASDPRATTRAIHAGRHFSSWTDAEGAFCYQGRDTADRGARLVSHLGSVAKGLRRARHRAGERGEPEAALRADALYALVTRRTRGSGTDSDPDLDLDLDPDPDPDPDLDPGPGGDPMEGALAATPAAGPGPIDPDTLALVDRPPPCSVGVRVDLDVLFGGEDPPEGVCELDGIGPVPVAMARDLVNDAFVRLVFHRAGDIRAVSHLGRTIKASLRTAVVERDRHCVVPGCRVSSGLEIDHTLPITEGGPTELDNLALLCHHHHHLKSYGGWTLARTGTTEDSTPKWSFTPDAPFGQEPGLGIDTPEGQRDWHRQQE